MPVPRAHRLRPRRPLVGAAWTAARRRCRTRARHSAGQADVAWGMTRAPIATSTRSSRAAPARSLSNGGVFFCDLGQRRRELRLAAARQLGDQPRARAIEPAIAVDRTQQPRLRRLHEARLRDGRLHRIARQLADHADLVASDGGTTLVGAARASPRSRRPAHYRSPSLAVLPDGRVIVAFRNDTPDRPADRDRDLRPLPRPPAANYCGAAERRTVGAEHASSAMRRRPRSVERPRRRADARASSRPEGGSPSPGTPAPGRRARVRRDVDERRRDVRARAADRPVGRGQPDRPATRRRRAERPRRRRVPLGCRRQRASSSRRRPRAGPPLAGATTEAWAQPRRRAGRRRQRVALPIPGQQAPLGRRLGSRRPPCPAPSPLPATVVAFTDTSAGHAGRARRRAAARHDRAVDPAPRR